MCQQAVEKCLKAVILTKAREVPPIHNLRRLAELTGLTIDSEKLKMLDFLSEYYVNSRYKEDLAELSKGLTKDFAGEILVFTKQVIEWLIQGIKY